MTTAGHELTEQASALLILGRVDEAKAMLAKRLAQDPEDVRAWSQLGRCHEQLKEYEQAVEATGAALAIDPEYVNALIIRTYALRRLRRTDESLAAAQEAVRLAPHYWQSYMALAEALNAWQPRWPEVLAAAQEAVRLGPEETGAYGSLWKAALLNGRSDLVDLAVRETLRIDPNDAWALSQQAEKQLAAPGMKPKQRAEVYASALAADPASDRMRLGLDRAVFQMLRRTRWLAVLSLVLAGAAIDLFPSDGEAKELPLPLGIRVYVLALIGVIWALGAWWRYRRMRAGVQLSVRSLLRRMFWARLVLVQAVLGTLCAVAIAAVPWTGRGVPQVLFWVGLVPTLLTIWFDRPRTRQA
ncbi:tetratricopeptide repeat protein [Streptomyces atratus]|uniref:Translation initiation factor IF-2 n=1 Tax=Streptomyces atratus TaxID=1893 RepID=A0A2Z5JG59_STRAR|nr:tetratricopeptide repeat protein [Streptomyces atratus]AXE79366.1 translation initiation factor IF-2 [Streptomyces atratus]